MYRKLQQKFLWGSALVLLLVISIVIGVIYWATNRTVTQQAQVMIDLILDNSGTLPERSEFAPQQQTFLALNDESIHEARYFSILFSEDVPQVISLRIAAMPKEGAVSLAESVINKQPDSGRVAVPGNRVLHYTKRTNENGSTLIVFVDSTSRYSLSQLIVTYMAALWLLVLIIYIVVMTHLSKKLIEPFVENDERQKRFITNASHELKTPLAVIAANNEMSEAIGGRNKWTESTSRQLRRLQSLIEDLVVLARLDEMKDIALSDTDFSAIVSETTESFRDVIESSGKQYIVRIDPDVHVNGEKRALQQLTSILLDNAAKYCDDGGLISVRLEKNMKSRSVLLTVANTYAAGKSVDTERFFERFYRQDESHNSEKKGFGIGLSMAWELTERLKGRIGADQAGNDISFTVEW